MRHSLFRVVVLMFLAVPLLAGAAGMQGEQDEAWVVGYVDFPPFTYTDENGKAAGYLNDITREVAGRAGQKLQFIEVPPAQARKGPAHRRRGHLPGHPHVRGTVRQDGCRKQPAVAHNPGRLPAPE
ncbi:MAG: transporter substrate-binding domain-containing protein [Spiribacter salinus]|uniref:Transporter substrate-binding domain-containing protein n=1 Tax=Spiribacter salinus TaxID=1335746 RepID=A0A540VRH1_9GAMM|nr:MAG: transporter substrate-binding domain-containing protein [Spiribacter salinus]